MAVLALALVDQITSMASQLPTEIASAAADDVSLLVLGRGMNVLVALPQAVMSCAEVCVSAGLELASDKAFAIAPVASLGATGALAPRRCLVALVDRLTLRSAPRR